MINEISKIYIVCNPDKPDNISHKDTKTQRKKLFYKNFVPWCLGGEILLSDKFFANMT